MRFGQTTGRSHRQQALVPDRALTFPLPERQGIPERTYLELASKKESAESAQAFDFARAISARR
jgi:hypothetical protein